VLQSRAEAPCALFEGWPLQLIQLLLLCLACQWQGQQLLQQWRCCQQLFSACVCGDSLMVRWQSAWCLLHVCWWCWGAGYFACHAAPVCTQHMQPQPLL
jgi:hypothetical protein